MILLDYRQFLQKFSYFSGFDLLISPTLLKCKMNFEDSGDLLQIKKKFVNILDFRTFHSLDSQQNLGTVIENSRMKARQPN